MYKQIAMLILSGLLVTACDKKAEAPAETTAAPAVTEEAAPAATETMAATEEAATETTETAAATDAPAASQDEVGVAECDEYITKYRACMSKLPEEGRAAYQQALDQMISGWKQVPTESRSSLAEGCKMSIESSRTAMQAMGCDW